MVYLRSVTWSADGETLYAGARDASMEGRNPVYSWNSSGRGTAIEQYVASDTISHLARCGPRITVATAEPAFGFLDNAGQKPEWANRDLPDFRGLLKRNFTVSPNGTRLRFTIGYHNSRPLVFDLNTLTVEDAPESLDGLLPPETEGVPISSWENSTAPAIGGRALKLDSSEISRSLAISPHKQRFVIGAEWTLRSYDVYGTVLWEKPAPNTTWGVNIPPDGKLVVAGYADGTIRWHRLADGQELLALFVLPSDGRFVVWTPKGYYYASPQADTLIGWQVNRTWDSAPDFFSVSRFRAQYQRPDIVSRVIIDGDEDLAVSRANGIFQRKTEDEDIRKKLPPVVKIIWPADYSTTNAKQIVVQYSLRSPSGMPVRRVFAQIAGRPVAGAEDRGIGAISENQVLRELKIALPPGDIELSLIAEGDQLSSEPTNIKLLRIADPQQDRKPNLFALIAGVGRYDEKSIEPLGQVPANDARDISTQLEKERGRAFKNIERRLLVDDEVTQQNIVDRLDWLLRNVQDANDIALVYFSGHGMSIPGAGSYLLPYEYNPARHASSAIDKDRIVNILKQINGKVIVFVDACRAETSLQFTKLSGVRRLDTVGLLNHFSASENGIITFASSTGEEESHVAETHSMFTQALLESLSGAVRPEDRVVRTDDIIGYLQRRVRYLAQLKSKVQTPAMAKSPRAKPVVLSIIP